MNNIFNSIKNIYIVGIKGVAMANLALIFKKMGKRITGSDVDTQFITEELLLQNQIEIGDLTQTLPPDIDLVIYSGAHGGVNNSQVKAARARGIKVLHQAEIMGELIKLFDCSIGVCGCHGKTSTASLLAYSLIKLKVKPSYLVGVPTFGEYWGSDYQGKKYLVLEADEYGISPPVDLTPKFNFMHPEFIIATNIDFDHPDVYKDLSQIKRAFSDFFVGKTVFACGDDKELLSVLKTSKHTKYETFGFNQSCNLKVSNLTVKKGTSFFDLTYNNKFLGNFSISLFGQKIICNAAGVVLCLLHLGFKPELIRVAISDFIGAKRRLEVVHENSNITIIDDYGHHPNEIATTITALKLRYPKKRLIAVFQPHTYSRTLALLPEFIKSLSEADYSLIAPVFGSARENKINSTQVSTTIRNKIKEMAVDNVLMFDNLDSLTQKLFTLMRKQDVIFTIGAGDIYKLGSSIIKAADKTL